MCNYNKRAIFMNRVVISVFSMDARRCNDVTIRREVLQTAKDRRRMVCPQCTLNRKTREEIGQSDCF